MMNKVLLGVLIAATALTGCKSKSEEGGRAGNDTFRLVVPATVTEIAQGELQTVQLTLERGEGFKQRVKLEIKAPSGLEVDPKDATVEPSDKGEVQLKVTATKDAAVGEHKIMVKGTPDKGEPTETEFRVNVKVK
jgi:uncharacterized membrane protein